jgi:hypothetical protein
MTSENGGFTVEYTTKDVLDKIEKLGESFNSQFNELRATFDHAINGNNGNEGIKPKQTRFEQIIDNVKSELVIHRWAIGLVATLIVGIIFKVI